MSFCHLKTRTTYSLRKSTIKPELLVKRAKQQGAVSLAITEQGNLFSSVKIYNEAKKQKIKPIFGCTFYIQPEKKIFYHNTIQDNPDLNYSELTVLCKNLDGWKDLLKAIETSNSHDNYNIDKERPTIKIEDLAFHCHRNWIVYTGNMNSWIIKNIYPLHNQFIIEDNPEEIKAYMSTDWKKQVTVSVGKLGEWFGRENIRLELQKVDINDIPAANTSAKAIEWISNEHNIPIIATCNPYYLNKEDSADQKILLCVDKKTTLMNLDSVLLNNPDPEYRCFTKANNAYLLNFEEYSHLYDQKYLQNNIDVSNSIEEFDITSKPKLPNYNNMNNSEADDYLKKLCDKGLEKLGQSQNPAYIDRLKYELEVIKKAGMASYMLIIWDVKNYCESNNWLASSRGSAGGSLIIHSLGISLCDPIKYNLIFERFYNDGRNTADNISIPDIDFDIMSQYREHVVQYVRNKYGFDKTGYISTFGGLQGAGALKEVLRVTNKCSVQEQNEITKLIIHKDKISDELEELRLSGEDPSIIGWSLENIEKLKDYCQYGDNGELVGEYAKEFAQAIKLEGCKRFQGMHACGLCVSNVKLNDFCPMVYNKKIQGTICGLEKDDLASIGGVKYDFLSCSSLDDIIECINLVNNGDYLNEPII